MIRFILVALATAAALCGALFLSASAHAQQAPTPAISGEWIGKYVCSQGITALKLNVSQSSSGALTATFSFGPLPENPNIPSGAYRMEGAFDPLTRKVKLHGVKWIEAPDNYVMVDLDGRVDTDGARIDGRVPPQWMGCSVFEVRRSAPLIS